MLDARAERTLAEVTEQLRTLCGERLVSVALYGSGVGGDYVVGRSDLNLAVILQSVDRATLVALRAHTPDWHKRSVATPLVLDRTFLRTAVDVFPLELYDIRERHRLLHGEDVFTQLQIHDQHLRYECEYEARGKLLRLRELYLEVGDNRGRLQELVLDSLKTFLIIARTLVRMRGVAVAPVYEAALDAFCREFACPLPLMSQLLRIKLGKEPWSGAVEDVFHAYANEVDTLVRVIDQLS
jgi:hypothetical protein